MNKTTPIRYISHPLLKKGVIESRIYQQMIFNKVVRKNTIVVLPAGLGKTIIAILLVTYSLNKHMDKSGKINTKCIFLTPTKPLVLKRTAILQKKLVISSDRIRFIMGTISNEKRAGIFNHANVLVMTPQVLLSDLNRGLYDLKNVSLIVFDECHRAMGDHAYVKIADLLYIENTNGRILGLTSSLGNKRITEDVCENLRIQSLEKMPTHGRGMTPYHPPKKIEWRMIPLPKSFQTIRNELEKQFYAFIQGLTKKNVRLPDDPRKVTIKQLVELQNEFQDKLSTISMQTRLSTNLKLAIAQISACIRLLHLIERIETQGMSSAKRFIDKLRNRAFTNKKERMLRRFCNLSSIRKVYQMIEQGLQQGYEHPKLIETVEIIKKQLSERPDSRILIFSNYRASVQIIERRLKKVKNMSAASKVSAAGLVGHKHKGAIGGLSSKQQMMLLKRFEDGVINIIVATSVAEQGLDLIDCDLVLFYDCVPEHIRAHQRRNRTGKQRQGRVIILITKGTADERYFWIMKETEKLKEDMLDRESQD